MFDGYTMLMKPNKAERAVHGCHCPGDKAVRMCPARARPSVDTRVSSFFFFFFFFN